MFINLSNHPSSKWQEKQIAKAQEYGEIIDIPFPQISPYASKEDVRELVAEYYVRIHSFHPDAVFVAGEFTFVYQIVNALNKNDIPVFSSCSKRNAIEKINGDGSTEKISFFDFIDFRKYEDYQE